MTTLTAQDAILTGRAESIRAGERTAFSEWGSLYRVGGWAALAVLALVPIQMVVFFVWPPPISVIGWFELLQANALIGLLDMDLLMIVDYGLLALFFLGLYVALRRTSPSFAAIALTAELLAVAAYFASTTPFEMLTLSGQYAAAVTDAERLAAVAAGQATYAVWQGTAFDVSYILSAAAALIASVLMLRSSVFGRATAYAGILMGVAGLVPPTVGGVGLVMSLVSLIPMWIWLFLAGRKLLQLARS
jgi:hypothetical protein